MPAMSLAIKRWVDIKVANGQQYGSIGGDAAGEMNSASGHWS